MEVMFPHQIKPREARFRIVGQSQEGHQTLSGAETVVPAFGARWVAALTYTVTTREAALALQAFLAGMEGRLGTTLVAFRTRFRPLDRNGRKVVQNLTGGFETFQHFGLVAQPTVTATVMLAAGLRATRLTYYVGNSTGLQPGQIFSIGERAYRAQLVWQDTQGRDVVQFQPPLRDVVVAGAVIVLDAVICRMRLQSDADFDVDELGREMQDVALQFVEAI